MFHVEHFTETHKSKLQSYLDLILKWQKKINLISPTTIDSAWERHIEDSAQLTKFIPDDTIYIVDLGSGAGLPGIPLAINSNKEIFLIESDSRKSIFLLEAVRTLELKNCHIINSRIETARLNFPPGKIVITARALADLPNLLELIDNFIKTNYIANYILLLPKGKNVSRETFPAKKQWKFDLLEHKSVTSEESIILEITNLTKNKEQK